MERTERIYAIIHTTKKLGYVGRTYRTFKQRWAEHQAGAADPLNMKPLYEAMRHDPDFKFIELDESGEGTEREWSEALQLEGYTLLNATGTNTVQPKKRDLAKEREWRQLNHEAEIRTAPKQFGPREELANKIEWKLPIPTQTVAEAKAERAAELAAFMSSFGVKKTDTTGHL